MVSNYMVCLQGNAIETTVTSDASVVCEWVNEVKSTAHIYQNIVGIDSIRDNSNGKTVILQFCIGAKCLLYQTLHSDKNISIDFNLAHQFLYDDSLLFAGIEVESKYPINYFFRPHNYVDIQKLAVTRWCWPRKGKYPNNDFWPKSNNWKPGLRALAKSIADLNIDSPSRVMFSNWMDKELSVEQIEYACIEVYASFRIGWELLKHGNAMPKMMKSADDDDDE